MAGVLFFIAEALLVRTKKPPTVPKKATLEIKYYPKSKTFRDPNTGRVLPTALAVFSKEAVEQKTKSLRGKKQKAEWESLVLNLISETSRSVKYNEKVDRYYDARTGHWVNSFIGDNIRASRASRRSAFDTGTAQTWKEKLREKYSKSVRKRKRRPPPKTPDSWEESYDLDIRATSGPIGPYMDRLIYVNEDYMDEEVTY